MAGCQDVGTHTSPLGRLLKMPKQPGAWDMTPCGLSCPLGAICQAATCFSLSTLASLLTQPAHTTEHTSRILIDR